jgi:hypothetical protein
MLLQVTCTCHVCILYYYFDESFVLSVAACVVTMKQFQDDALCRRDAWRGRCSRPGLAPSPSDSLPLATAELACCTDLPAVGLSLASVLPSINLLT